MSTHGGCWKPFESNQGPDEIHTITCYIFLILPHDIVNYHILAYRSSGIRAAVLHQQIHSLMRQHQIHISVLVASEPERQAGMRSAHQNHLH
jgi:hypothetical protein